MPLLKRTESVLSPQRTATRGRVSVVPRTVFGGTLGNQGDLEPERKPMIGAASDLPLPQQAIYAADAYGADVSAPEGLTSGVPGLNIGPSDIGLSFLDPVV
jgi:hypothetical protein